MVACPPGKNLRDHAAGVYRDGRGTEARGGRTGAVGRRSPLDTVRTDLVDTLLLYAYPSSDCGYGYMFWEWASERRREPHNSLNTPAYGCTMGLRLPWNLPKSRGV